MTGLAQLLLQFVFRISFGMALSMAFTPSRYVTSGFYRVHLWVLMGLNTFAAAISYLNRGSISDSVWAPSAVVPLAVVISVTSYVGAICWLYEKPRPGKVMLIVVCLLSLTGAICATAGQPNQLGYTLSTADVVTSGALCGTILTAMFLGHWYLNTPTMDLRPLRLLLTMVHVFLALRIIVSVLGLGLSYEEWKQGWAVLLALRWLAGVAAILVLNILTQLTLKIPNTQSATGILYAAVIFSFIGELTSQMLTLMSPYPL